jgi:hypothetical protein
MMTYLKEEPGSTLGAGRWSWIRKEGDRNPLVMGRWSRIVLLAALAGSHLSR